MKISFLADHPEFIVTLAPWVFEHWRPMLPGDTLETRVGKLKMHMNYEMLPIAWVAHTGSDVFGTAALRKHDLPDHQNLTPWLGGVYVAPQYRRQGIGEQLCAAVEQHAKEVMGIDTLYLFTLDKQDWYKRLGWSTVQPCGWCGSTGEIMQKNFNTC
jgi:GNAT superfamily N-acetyltransferase